MYFIDVRAPCRPRCYGHPFLDHAGLGDQLKPNKITFPPTTTVRSGVSRKMAKSTFRRVAKADPANMALFLNFFIAGWTFIIGSVFFWPGLPNSAHLQSHNLTSQIVRICLTISPPK